MISQHFHKCNACSADVDDLHPLNPVAYLECQAAMDFNVRLNDGERWVWLYIV